MKFPPQLKSKFGLKTLPHWKTLAASYLQYGWIQDIGEPFSIVQNGQIQQGFLDLNKPLTDAPPTKPWPIEYDKSVGLDLPLENSDFSMEALRDYFNWKSVRMPSIKRKYDPNFMGNQGGNLEVLPTGRLMTGNTAPPEMIDFIRKVSGQDPLILDVGFLIVGHVDEIVSFVRAQNSVGFALIASNLLKGLLIELEAGVSSLTLGSAEDNTLQALQHFVRDKNKFRSVSDFAHAKVTDFDLTIPLRVYKNGDYKGYPYGSDWIVFKTIQGQEIMERNIIKLVEEIQKTHRDFNMNMVAEVPITVGPSVESDFTQADPDIKGKQFVTFGSPTANLVAIGEDLIMADFTNVSHEIGDTLKNSTLNELTKVGISSENVHFVDASDYHRGMGSIHCGTLLVRTPSN